MKTRANSLANRHANSQAKTHPGDSPACFPSILWDSSVLQNILFFLSMLHHLSYPALKHYIYCDLPFHLSLLTSVPGRLFSVDLIGWLSLRWSGSKTPSSSNLRLRPDPVDMPLRQGWDSKKVVCRPGIVSYFVASGSGYPCPSLSPLVTHPDPLSLHPDRYFCLWWRPDRTKEKKRNQIRSISGQA